jgi:hypothetical protein
MAPLKNSAHPFGFNLDPQLTHSFENVFPSIPRTWKYCRQTGQTDKNISTAIITPAQIQSTQAEMKIQVGTRNVYKRQAIGRYVNKTAASHLRRQRILLKAASKRSCSCI